MPSVSRNQQIATAIAEHDPEKLYKRNAALKKMSKQQLHDFASTPRAGLPRKVPHHERTKAYMAKRKDKAIGGSMGTAFGGSNG